MKSVTLLTSIRPFPSKEKTDEEVDSKHVTRDNCVVLVAVPSVCAGIPFARVVGTFQIGTAVVEDIPDEKFVDNASMFMFVTNLPSLSSESISLIESKQSLLVSTSIWFSVLISSHSSKMGSHSEAGGAGAGSWSQESKIAQSESSAGSSSQVSKISQSAWGLACRW